VPFKPVVVDDPFSFPDADGLVVNGCGLPMGAANAIADGAANAAAFLARERFGADFLRVDFAICFLADFRFAVLTIDATPSK
jgi:hypothetical protein